MSNQAITWAYQQRGLKPGPKFLLVTLGNYADENAECFPGIDTLAADCDMHRATVIRGIQTLEEEEKIEIIHRGGDGSGRKSNIYRLACSHEFSGKVANCDIGGKVANCDGLSRKMQLAKSQNATKGKVANCDGQSRKNRGAKSQNATRTLREPPVEPPVEREEVEKRGGQQQGGGVTHSPIPDCFEVTKEHRDYAKIHGLPNPDELIHEFKNHQQSKGNMTADWDAEFRKWMHREKRYVRTDRSGGGKNSRLPEYARLPFDNEQLEPHAIKHNLQRPGSLDKYGQYRSKLQIEIDARLVKEGYK